jgi:hypothetical protein
MSYTHVASGFPSEATETGIIILFLVMVYFKRAEQYEIIAPKCQSSYVIMGNLNKKSKEGNRVEIGGRTGKLKLRI